MDVEFLRYLFEDGYYGVIVKNGFKVGIRHLQLLYMFTNSIVLGCVRGSMGVAVLATADPTRYGDTYIKIHNWDSRIQGAVLSSFLFGYTLMLVPSELFLRRVGGKLLMTAVLIVNGALCVAMPTIINKGGWVAACNANLFMGMAHACLHTINQSLFDRWMPPNEKRIFSCLLYGGVQIGIIISLPVTGLLSAARLGWELIYYSLAMMTLSMAVISGTLMASTPESHQAVGDGEKELIKETLNYYKKKELKRPWKKILKSPPFWGVTSAHIASNVLFIFYLTKVPAYLWKLHNIILKDSAWYTMLPFISLTAAFFILEPIINWIYRIRYFNYILNATFFRKVVNIFASVGIIIGLTVLSNLPRECDYLTVLILIGILGLLGFQFCGFLSSYQDMSENYSGTLMLLSSTVSSAVGTAVPYVAGLILGDAADSRHWRVVLLTLASFYLLCNIVYISLGSNERQEWDHIRPNTKLNHYNGVLNVNQVQLDELGYSNPNHVKHEIDTAL